ncbi:MAG: hypothetical protein Q9225_003463 [Loekoesia sp. 1 TL-2023]
MQEILMNTPANGIHFVGEAGEIRENTITFEEAKVLSRATVDALFEAWTQLRTISAKHQTTLNKRWSRKTFHQRKEILSKAWPEMPCMHRPDFEVLRQEQKTKGWSQKAKFATDSALRFPHLNIEDLSQPKPLLLMFDSRCRHPPSIFTNADRDSIQAGIRSKMIVPKYMRGYAMYLNGEPSREAYGRLVSWEQDRQAILKCHQGIAPDPGMGLLILEIQRDVLQFLVRCSAAILHDTPMAELIRPQTDRSLKSSMSQPELQLKDMSPSIALTTEHESVTAHTLEAPYRAPDAYNFERLKTLVEAKRREVEDHFLLIREDPAYFAELIYEACGHSVEAILNRQYIPGVTPLAEASWNRVISLVLMTAYHDAFMWERVSHLLNRLIDTHKKQEANIQPGQILPGAYVKAFSYLGFFLVNVNDGYLGALPDYMSAVPTFKNHIVNQPHGSGKYKTYITRHPELLNHSHNKEEICGLSNLLQEMETLIRKDQHQKERLSWRLIRLISDVAVIAEIQRQIGLSSCNEYCLSAWSDEDNDAWTKIHMAPLLKIREVFQEGTGLAPLVTDLRVFDYPSDKPRTAVTTAKMRSAEQALDNFWEALNQHFIRKTGKTLKELEDNRIHYRDIQRTPEWIDPQPFVKGDRNKGKATEDFDASLALTILEERTRSTVEQFQPSVAGQKVKTRGAPIYHTQTESPNSRPEKVQDTTDVTTPKLTVKKKAFNTFAALFGKPVPDSKLPGELPWNEFKKAMVNVGFSAEKLQGSAWLFNSGLKSIVFHEPHPESKLPMQWARRIARRLNRNFGWTAETFVPENAASEENNTSDLA